MVIQKGSHWYSIKVLSGVIESLGHSRVILKSDQEPAILALKDSVKSEVRADVIMEESPEYESRNSGEVERAVQMVQGQFRTMKDRLESRYRQRIGGEHPCIPWLIAHASDTINRCHVYKDGKTAFENWKGRQFRGQYREFGEGVLYMRPNSKGQDKFDVRWETGIWMGIADRTGEIIIGTKDGVVKARDIRSLEEKEAWDVGRFNDIRGTPWEPIPGREGIEIKSKVVIPASRTEPRQLVEGEEKEFIVRRARISREVIRKVGFTIGCPGCRAVNRGQSAVYHNEECRRRI